MRTSFIAPFGVAVALAAVVAAALSVAARADDDVRCLDDAMLVFDASGSMAGTDLEVLKPHIDKVRDALAAVLPDVAPRRHLGLVVYGPGPRGKCENVELRLRPGPNSAETIMSEVDAVVPAGETPLTDAVRHAAEVLRFRDKPAVVVLLTDGEETCGGDPCGLARQLKAEAQRLTIHVVGFRVKGADTWLKPGAPRSACMAEQTGGLALTARDRDELVAALKKTMTCPLFSQATERD